MKNVNTPAPRAMPRKSRACCLAVSARSELPLIVSRVLTASPSTRGAYTMSSRLATTQNAPPMRAPL